MDEEASLQLKLLRVCVETAQLCIHISPHCSALHLVLFAPHILLCLFYAIFVHLLSLSLVSPLISQLFPLPLLMSVLCNFLLDQSVHTVIKKLFCFCFIREMFWG